MTATDPSTLHVTASAMWSALSTVIGRRRKHLLVRLSPKPQRQALLVAEYRHRRGVAEEVAVTGSWHDVPIVDAQQLHHLFSTYDENAVIELARYDGGLLIQNGRSRVQMRVDHIEPLAPDEEEIPAETCHDGPVAVPPDPDEKRVELDHTWIFSARMPVPQHRIEKDASTISDAVSSQQTPTGPATFAETIRDLRTRYKIGLREMARRIGWDVQRYRRYEDPEQTAGQDPRWDLIDEVWRGLKDAGVPVHERTRLLPPALQEEVQGIIQRNQDLEQRLAKIQNALDDGRSGS